MTSNKNIALLIDADNVSPSGLDPALTILAELGSVNIKRAYGNWTKPSLKGWAALTQRYAIEPQQQFDITKGKNATDMKIAIDAMDLLYSGQVEGFGIMSSDGDFMPVVMRLRQSGFPVYGFGAEKAPEGFREACTRFFDLGAIEQTQSNGEKPEPKAVDNEVVALLSVALKASKRDEKGFASLSEVGQRASSRSSFDARNYGFTRLSDLVASLPQFTTERRDGGMVCIKRVM